MYGVRVLTLAVKIDASVDRVQRLFLSDRSFVKTLKRTFLSYLFVIGVVCGSYFGV